MALLKEWQKVAYDETKDRGTLQRFWANYFNLEKGVYERLLEEPDVEVKGTVKELAEKYGLSIMEMTGFLDGINESLVEANPIEEMEEDTVVSLKFDKEKLYKNMVDAKADWLYELPQWDKIFDKEKKHELYLEQKDYPVITNPGLASEELKLEDKEYFVLGDNRNNSVDSRFADVGMVKSSDIEGKVWFVLSPSEHRGFLNG